VCVVCFFHSCSLCNWPLGCWVSTQINENWIELLISPLNTGLSRCSFPWASGAPHHSGFKLRTVALSSVCAMFPGWQFLAMNLWNACLVFLPGIFSVLWLLFLWPQWLLVPQNITCSTFAGFLCIDFYILISFPLIYVLHSCLMALIHLSVCKFFLFSFLLIIFGLFTKTSLSVCTPRFHSTVISSCSHTGLGTYEYEYQLSDTSIPNSLNIEWCKCVQTS
jgi:hypothetical protein